jgi:group I intron endonuclease
MTLNNNSKMNRNEKRKKATKRKNKKNKRKSSKSGPSGNKRQRLSSDTSEIGETKEADVLHGKFDDGRLNVVEKTAGDITAKTGSIYIITNIITLLSYIGLTIREVEIRWQEHEYSGKNPKYHFHHSIAKHGWKNFKCETLAENVPIEELAELEIYYIKEHDTYNNGYNSTVGGEGTMGRIWTEEQRIALSKAMTTTRDYIEGGGTITYHKDRDIWHVMSSAMSGRIHIGQYFTKGKSIAALKLYNRTKVCMHSDIRKRRNGTGSVSYDKSQKKWVAYGPQTSSVAQYIGQYDTKEKAIKALDIFIDTGNRMPSDVTMRKRGTGSISYAKNIEKWRVYGPQTSSGLSTTGFYVGQYDLEKRAIEALDHFDKTGECLESDVTMRKRGTGSITERNGRYRGKIIIDKVPYLTKTYGSRQQAEEDLKKIILEVNNGTYTPPIRGRPCYIWEIGKEDAKTKHPSVAAAARENGFNDSTAVARIIKYTLANNPQNKWRGEYIE